MQCCTVTVTENYILIQFYLKKITEVKKDEEESGAVQTK